LSVSSENLSLIKADGPGPMFEFKGGTPYHFAPSVYNFPFKNPGYK